MKARLAICVISTAVTLCATTRSIAQNPLPNDSDFHRQWWLHNQGQQFDVGLEPGTLGADIDILSAWNIHVGNPAMTVAIVGRGIDPHPEFSSRLLEGRSFVVDPFDTRDSCPQDTHLAGIIAAQRDNGLGIAGINDRAFILPVKTLDGCGGRASVTAEGIRWAVDQGASIILAAVQFGQPNIDLALAMDYAAMNDVLVVAPAGSEGAFQVTYPGAYDGCVAVSATDADDQWSPVSNQGPEVELSAPGKAIWSIWTHGSFGYQVEGRDTVTAAAVVAGVASLIRSYNPELTVEEVRQILRDTADDLGLPGRDTQFGFGRISAGRALALTPAPALRIERLMTLPRTIPPGRTSQYPVRVLATENPLASAFMFYQMADVAFVPSPMIAQGDNLFTVEFPALACDTEIFYFFLAADQTRLIVADPPGAIDQLHSLTAIYEQVLFEDDFENDLGWTVEGGDNTTGRWTREEPVGTTAQPEYDRSPDEGQLCFFTGQHLGGEDIGANDVDGGPLRLTSPSIAIPTRDIIISYASWFSWNGQGLEDFLTVELSLDDGASWTLADTIASTNAWVTHELSLVKFPGLSGDQLRLRFATSDLPNDSLTEAAIDDVVVTARLCEVSLGDADLNGVINQTDFAAMLACWDPSSLIPPVDLCQRFDFDHNFRVDLVDFQKLQAAFGP